MGKFQDLTGMVFGELTVIKRAPDYILPCGKPQTLSVWLLILTSQLLPAIFSLRVKSSNIISGFKYAFFIFPSDVKIIYQKSLQ